MAVRSAPTRWGLCLMVMSTMNPGATRMAATRRKVPGVRTEPIEVIHVSVTEPQMFSTVLGQKTTRTTLTHAHGTLASVAEQFQRAFTNMPWVTDHE